MDTFLTAVARKDRYMIPVNSAQTTPNKREPFSPPKAIADTIAITGINMFTTKTTGP